MSDVSTQFYIHTYAAWESMLDDIKNAQTSVDIEQYIFTIDTIGKKFLDALYERVHHGVKVRIICDAVGSYGFFSSEVPRILEKVGIEVRFFNPISLWWVTKYSSNFFRDHRKLMIVDGHIAHIGGVGIQDKMREWRDTHMRIKGPLVQDIAETFLIMWNRMEKSSFIRFPRVHHYVKNYRLMTNAPRIGQRFLYRELIANIRNAQKYIYLTTPYFIPDVRLFRVLKLAAKRGVDVRLLVPEIADSLFINNARESYFSSALKAGIKIYIYKPVIMHAKTAVIDDEWATAGSFNLDSLSLHFNTEANVSSEDREFIVNIKVQFLNDSALSQEIVLSEWNKRSWRRKFLEFLTWPFHSIM